MPLEIREIGIGMRVGDEAEPADARARGDQAVPRREEIVDECVRRVLAALKTRQER